MNKYRYLKPAMIAAAFAVALPAAAQTGFRYDDYNNADVRYDYARVVKVDAIVNRDSQPVSRETCWQQPTTSYQYRPSYTYYKDDDDDDTPDAVTVESGYRAVSAREEHCRTETNYRSINRVLGYDVTYRYGGREYHAQLDHDPGERMRVRVNYDYSVTPGD